MIPTEAERREMLREDQERRLKAVEDAVYELAIFVGAAPGPQLNRLPRLDEFVRTQTLERAKEFNREHGDNDDDGD